MSLSVLMANYNHGCFLRQALPAILSQGAPSEIVFVDDGSKDDSLTTARYFAARDARLRVLHNSTNQGMVATFQRALESSTGKYVYFASADDIVLPGFFDKSMHLLARHPEAGLSCAFHSTLDGETGVINRNPTWLRETPGYLSPQALTGKLLKGGIPGHTSILRRDAFLRAGGYRPELRWHCDWFVSLVLAFRHGICFLPETLALSRVYPSSYSAAGRCKPEAQREVLAHVLKLLLAPAYADVLPYFQESQVLSAFQPDLTAAAAELNLQDDSRLESLLRTRRWHDETVWRWRSQRVRSRVLRWPFKSACSVIHALRSVMEPRVAVANEDRPVAP